MSTRMGGVPTPMPLIHVQTSAAEVADAEALLRLRGLRGWSAAGSASRQVAAPRGCPGGSRWPLPSLAGVCAQNLRRSGRILEGIAAVILVELQQKAAQQRQRQGGEGLGRGAQPAQ